VAATVPTRSLTRKVRVAKGQQTVATPQSETSIVVTREGDGEPRFLQAGDSSATGSAEGGGDDRSSVRTRPFWARCDRSRAGAISELLGELVIEDVKILEMGEAPPPRGSDLIVFVRRVTGDEVLERLGEFDETRRVSHTSLDRRTGGGAQGSV
jgi:uncharacterized membrane protein